ncbi:MAG: SDR family NAD(P)-dependent oxidoreductase [Dehalococcoidia bacterium]
MAELSGKVALITGVTSPQGIGFAIARRFAAGGASLFIVDANGNELEERANELAGMIEPEARVIAAPYDLSVAGQPEAMIAAAVASFGRVDVLCNNAAVRRNKLFGEYSYDDFDASVAVNLRAPFFASQAVAPVMREQGGGRIIHTASQLGLVTYDTRAVYGLTKAALIHLTKSMAYELAKDNIQVNAISPGPVYTQPIIDRESQDPDGTRQRIHDYVPAGRYGRPDEIAEVAFFLATTPATYLQGENIVIDGGYVTH